MYAEVRFMQMYCLYDRWHKRYDEQIVEHNWGLQEDEHENSHFQTTEEVKPVGKSFHNLSFRLAQGTSFLPCLSCTHSVLSSFFTADSSCGH